MAFSSLFFLILIQFFILQTASASSWQTLSGDPPIVIARGGFSGLFPDSSENAYQLANLTSSPDTILWCDLQLTKDGVEICFPNLSLDKDSNVMDVYPNNKEWFSVDFTWEKLSSDSDVRLVQNIKSRSELFDGVDPILTVKYVSKLGASGLWLNIQNSTFYKQHNLSMRNSVISLSRHTKLNFISSPEISFLKSMKNSVKQTVTKLIFRFLNQDQIDPFTNQSYGSLTKNLSYIKTFSSGILVPKSYIWPVSSDLYLQPHTSLVTDAHREGLQVFASDFSNDIVFAYNYSHDSTAEYLSYIDNGNFSVDGFLSDFPVTPFRAIKCFTHLDTKNTEQANVTIISNDGASGDFPSSTDLAYQRAVSDGVDILDCNVQMSKDKVPFCLSSIDLMNSTNVFETSFRNLSSVVSEIQKGGSGIYTFSLTMNQILTLKPAISNPHRESGLFRNPRNKNLGRFLTLSEFLLLPNRYNSISGILIKVEYAAYLAEHQGISIVDDVIDELKRTNASATKIMIQSSDKSVLMKFKAKKKMNLDELVYRVEELIHDVTDSAINDIKSFAGSIVIQKKSVLPYGSRDGFTRLHNETDVVPRLQSNGLRVFVELFSNEFVTQPFDFYADETLEIHTFVNGFNVDGIITDFPATTARYKKNQCYSKMELLAIGGLIPYGNPMLVPPAEAPYPALVDSDITEPPLPQVRSQAPASMPPKSKAKAQANALEVSFSVISMPILVSFFITV